MSDPAASNGPPGSPERGDFVALSPSGIEAILADFRLWLADLAGGHEAGLREGEAPAEPGALPARREPRPPGAVDLFTLVGQFTALRHEVNLQTKAARAAVEQNAEVLKAIVAKPEAPAEPEGLRAALKAVIDIADALALSLRQMEKLRGSVEPLLADLGEPTGASPRNSRSPGFFARLFGAKPALTPPTDEARTAAGKLGQLAEAAIDGYAMSIRRVERTLPTLDLEPISCTGEIFDPELMEVVEVVGGSGEPAGTVIEEVRPGYRWRGKVFRFAQVKVAR